jgi:hypothetical protein
MRTRLLCTLLAASACTSEPGLQDTGTCQPREDGNDSPEAASTTLPYSLDYLEPGERGHLGGDDVDWYVHEFWDGDWWGLAVRPDDPDDLEVLITTYDEDFVELNRSTSGTDWGYSDPDYPNNPGPVLRYLEAVANTGCGTYGFSITTL